MSSHYIKIVICAITLILFGNLYANLNYQCCSNFGCFGSCSCEDNKNSRSIISFSIDLGFGKAAKLFDSRETSVGLFVNFSRKNVTLSIRSLGNMEYIMTAGPSPVESYSDLSLLLGYKVLSDLHNTIEPLIGIGKVTSVKRGKQLEIMSVDANHEKLVDTVLGVSFGVKFQVNTKYSALGFYCFSNINKIKSYYGILFYVGLGKFY
jgi:hypothetical protein